MPPKKAASTSPAKKASGTPKKSPVKTKRSPTPPPATASPKKGAAATKKAEADEDKKPKKKGKKENDAEAAPIVRKQSSRGQAVTEENVLEGTVPFKRLHADKDFDQKKMLKFISWNVAGLRAVLKKGNELQTLVKKESPDVLCLQETKLSDWKDCPELGVIDGYEFFDSISVAKKGYSGTRTYVKKGTNSTSFPGFEVAKDPSKAKHDEEGRIVTTLVNVENPVAVLNTYVPNAGMTLDRLPYRVDKFDPMMRDYISKVEKDTQLPVIWTGDLNVAERDYDRFFASNFKQMQKSPGFTPEERESFRKTLQKTNTVDAFRHLYPNASKVYSFWSARFNQRAKGNGWRLDYFVLSASLVPRVVECFMQPEYTASDHCPVQLWLKK